MPTPLPVNEARARAAATVLALAASGLAHAHGDGFMSADTPGLHVGADVVVSLGEGDPPFPSRALSGFLLTGVAPEDRDGLGLEHATLGASLLTEGGVSATFAVGFHDDGEHHVERAWLGYQAQGQYGTAATPGHAFGVGRRPVPLGDMMGGDGHVEAFGLDPIAKRVAFDGDWIADGANLRINGSSGRLDWQLDAGWWRSDSFPAGSEKAGGPVIHLGLSLPASQADVFVARADVRERGAFIDRGVSGHTHGSPSCSGSGLQVLCFEGAATLFGASAAHRFDDLPLALSAAAIVRREHGDLSGTNGSTRYRATVTGGWLDAAWFVSADDTLTLRLEHAQAKNSVRGSGASAIARDAGLLPALDASRASVSWVRQLNRWTWVAAELGKERASGDDIGYGLIRLGFNGLHRVF